MIALVSATISRHDSGSECDTPRSFDLFLLGTLKEFADLHSAEVEQIGKLALTV